MHGRISPPHNMTHICRMQQKAADAARKLQLPLPLSFNVVGLPDMSGSLPEGRRGWEGGVKLLASARVPARDMSMFRLLNSRAAWERGGFRGGRGMCCTALLRLSLPTLLAGHVALFVEGQLLAGMDEAGGCAVLYRHPGGYRQLGVDM